MNVDYYKILRPLIFLFPAETAHNIAINIMKYNLFPVYEKFENDKLKLDFAGLNFKNPIGMSAGFDKNAEVIHSLCKANFGFIEVGTITPKPQEGNARPRIFRLKNDEAIINRLGFNNDGLAIFSQRLRKWKYSLESKNNAQNDAIIGANIGKNKDSKNAVEDYILCLESVYGLCDYVTVNISSPNTPDLREMQKKEILTDLVSEIAKKRTELENKFSDEKKLPIFIKISPDETKEVMEDIADIILQNSIDGVIISNTTISRNSLMKNKSAKNSLSNGKNFAEQNLQGGLSGKPLFELSTQKLELFYKISQGKIPIIGVGGISSANDVYTKIKKGASLVQLYTALIYQGFGLVNRINKDLVSLMENDGYENITQAIGVDVKA